MRTAYRRGCGTLFFYYDIAVRGLKNYSFPSLSETSSINRLPFSESFDPAPNFRLTLGRADFFVPAGIELRDDKV